MYPYSNNSYTNNNNIYRRICVCFLFCFLVDNIDMLVPPKGLHNNIPYFLLLSPVMVKDIYI